MAVTDASSVPLLPLSAVVATRNRAAVLSRTLASLLTQGCLPRELVVVDASADDSTQSAVLAFASAVPVGCRVRWVRAHTFGAAAQRNQGVEIAEQACLWFFDDDVVLEPGCLAPVGSAAYRSVSRGGQRDHCQSALPNAWADQSMFVYAS